MVFVEGDDYRQLRRPGDDPAQFRSVVRPAQGPVAPDSVIHQYRGENFRTDTWEDTAPSGPQADMSINGVSASALNGDQAASSDGVDDSGLASSPGPESLPENRAFGVAMVFNSTDRSSSAFFGAIDLSGTSRFELRDDDFGDGSLGEPFLALRDENGNSQFVQTDANLCDGTTRLLIVNVNSNDAQDINFYTDASLNSPIPQTIERNEAFDNTNYANSQSMGFFSRAKTGSIAQFKAFSTAFIEFNSQPYSSTERQDLKQRAPGL
jgi:hypothetical protein